MQSSFPLKIWPFLLLATAPVGAQQMPPTAPPVPLVAPEVSTEPEVSVDELVSRALANNPQLPIARQSVEAARQRVLAARAFPSPRLEVVPRILGDRTAADTEVILSQPLDLFGQRRARAAVAGAQLRAAQAQSTLAQRSLVVAVKNAAADLFAAQEAENLGQVQVEVAQLFRDAAARRAALGDVPPVQVQRADLELLRTQNELTGAQTERLARRAALNQLIGQAPETPLRVALPETVDLTDLLRVSPAALRSNTANSNAAVSAAPNTTIAVNATPNTSAAPVASSAQTGSDLLSLRGQILPNALANRPDLVGAQATLEERRAQVRVLASERLPIIELQVRRGAFFDQRASYALRAVITVPLFDFGSNKRERRALEAEAKAQESNIALLRSQAATQIEQALLRLQQQRQTVARYRSGIVPLTLDLLRKTQIGYAQGASTYLEVLEAQRTLRQVQTEYLQALVGTRTQEAALESALGATPPADLLGSLTNPTGASTPPGVAAPGTVLAGTIPPNVVAPLTPPNAEVQP